MCKKNQRQRFFCVCLSGLRLLLSAADVYSVVGFLFCVAVISVMYDVLKIFIIQFARMLIVVTKSRSDNILKHTRCRADKNAAVESTR